MSGSLWSIPRRCVNLPPGSLFTLLGSWARGRIAQGPATEAFQERFASYLRTKHVIGAASGRSAFQLALESLDLPKGSEIVFPAFTFPVMPMVAELLGYRPVFCEVDPETYNAGPQQIEPVLTENTGAVLATHLFGRPCQIREVAALARERDVRLLEDCAHALGVRVGGRHVGTFGDVGVYSFAEGKNMPCFGGGAIATSDARVAEGARQVVAGAAIPDANALLKKGASIWVMWLLTRPWVFTLSAYPILRLKQWLGRDLMDSAVGDDLLARFKASNPQVNRLANLQAAVGLKQLERIDRFNRGARKNAEILTEELGDVARIGVPPSSGDHIYVYYPLRVEPEMRDDLRGFLLRHGIDAKCTDMADCSTLEAFLPEGASRAGHRPAEASLLEICVYPILSPRQMRHVGRTLRAWGGHRGA